MVMLRSIQRLADEIAHAFRVESVVLFGSQAWGEPDADSDVDLLVVMRCRGNPIDREVAIRQHVRPKFPVDILVRTPAEVRRQLAAGDFFMSDIMAKGKVLYEATHAAVGRKSRGRFRHRAARASRKKVA